MGYGYNSPQAEFIALNTHIRTEEMSQINYLSITHENLEKEEQIHHRCNIR